MSEARVRRRHLSCPRHSHERSAEARCEGAGTVALGDHEGICHVSIGPSLCAITDQGKLSIPWSQGFSTADWSVAAASLTDVVEVVALFSVSQPGCVARTAGGQIWWIHQNVGQDPEIVSDEVVGIDGPVAQLVTGMDIDGDFVCALVLDGTVSCWTAGGGGGSVAPKDSAAPSVPRKVPGLPGVATGLAGGLGYACERVTCDPSGIRTFPARFDDRGARASSGASWQPRGNRIRVLTIFRTIP